MQRKPGFPVANCNIKMPDSMPTVDMSMCEEDSEHQQRRQQLINFGHSQWGFNNWNWTVTKQDLDFVDFSNGKYCAGVVAFVSITVKNFDLHRENIGYATTVAVNKGIAIHKSRKSAVTNALRETLLSFGGSVASELMDLFETHATNPASAQPEPLPETHAGIGNKSSEPKNAPLNKNIRKDSSDSGGSAANLRSPHPSAPIKNAAANVGVANPVAVNPIAANPIAANPIAANPVAAKPPALANLPPAANRAGVARAPLRPNSNVSFVLQPVVPQLYAPPRLPPPHAPHVFPNAYYEYPGPWHFAYEPHGNVNLNFNVPPKNLVVNGRAGSLECRNACARDEPAAYAPQPPAQACWIKPTIFYDGFWTEQKVKKWVAEQVEKQFPEDASQKSSSPSAGQQDAKA